MYQYYFFNQISKNSLYDFNNSLNDGIFRSVHIKGFYFHFIAYLFFLKKMKIQLITNVFIIFFQLNLKMIIIFSNLISLFLYIKMYKLDDTYVLFNFVITSTYVYS